MTTSLGDLVAWVLIPSSCGPTPVRRGLKPLRQKWIQSEGAIPDRDARFWHRYTRSRIRTSWQLVTDGSVSPSPRSGAMGNPAPCV